MIFDPDKERRARENSDVQKGLEQARRGELTDGPPKVDRRSGEDRRNPQVAASTQIILK